MKEKSIEKMRDVCIALVPAAIASIVLFGSQTFVLLLISVMTCMEAEALWQLLHDDPVTLDDFSAAVTGILIAFALPSSTPVWILIIADLFAIIIAKQMAGGAGHHIFNPALMGRLFMMVVYPTSMTAYVEGMNGDTTTGMIILGVLLLAGFVYLIYKKQAHIGMSIAFFVPVMAVVMAAGQDPLVHLLSGGLILGGCFMLTDHRFSSVWGYIIYGIAAGVMTAAVRLWGVYPGDICFGILIADGMSVLIDKIQMKHSDCIS